MGKKGKVNKLARMSDEERARYLQHRADLEEEARRRKRELVARFIKNKLDKEEAFSKINAAKINQEWRFILRKIKCKQMATEVEAMAASFSGLLARKGRLLRALLQRAAAADDQQRRAVQAHCETLAFFIGVGSQRLNQLQSSYEEQKSLLLEGWVRAESEAAARQEAAETQLRLVRYVQADRAQRDQRARGTRRDTRLNDVRLEHEENLRLIWRPKQIEIDSYFAQLHEVYNAFTEYHQPIMVHYQSMLEKDEFYQRDIMKNEQQIQEITENLSLLQEEHERIINIKAKKLENMKAQQENLTKKYFTLKKNTNENKLNGVERLTTMVEASQDAIKRLGELMTKLNKIKQLSEICLKYETKFEMSFSTDIILNEDTDFEHLDENMKKECQEYQKLNKFFLKVNRVKVHILCLKAEKAKLTKENVQMKNHIKRYLTELALHSEKERPTSMKLESKAHNTGVNEKIRTRPVTCIEGALSIAVLHEKRMKIYERQNKANEVKAYPRVQCWM